jgi:hypothetical protein
LHENNRCIAAELQEAGKILSILHYYLISAPDMALCLFEEKKSLDPILELAFGNFPVIISQPSINLIQKLACHLPLNMISEELDIVSESINRIRPFYRNLFTEKNKEPVDEALVRCHISLLHKLLSLPSAKSNVLGQLKAVMEEGSLWSKYAVLDIINDERGQIREGDLVYNREDGLKEPLLVLGSHQGFKVKAYLRDILYYRYDIKERKDHWSCKEETHSEHKQLTVNLRTGNYSFVHPDFITRVTKDPEPAHIAWLTKELQLASISLAQTDPASLLLAYKLFKVFKSAKDKAAKAAAKALFASLGLNALCEQYRYASPPANKINEYIHHVAETEEWAIPQTPAAPAKPGLYQTLKNKMLNKVKATHKPQVATPKFEPTDFNIFFAGDHQFPHPHAWNQLDVKSKEFASVNLIPLLHKALSESLTQVVYEGREASDTEYLLRELFEQQHRLKRNNVEDVRISELQIQIDLLFAEKELHELMVEVAAGCLKDDLRQESSVDLMLAVVANLRNIELARQVLLNLWDRIYARAQFIDALRFNKFAVASFVNHITQFISITEALKQKEDLVMDSKRTAQFGEMLLLLTLSTEEFSHMNLRKTFKQEYISPFLWYLLRHTLKNWRLNPEVALSKPHLEALTRFNRRMQELQEDPSDNLLIKGILLNNIHNLETLKATIKDQGKLQDHVLDTKQYTQWMCKGETNLESGTPTLAFKRDGQQVDSMRLTREQTAEGCFHISRTFRIDPSLEACLSTHQPCDFMALGDNLQWFKILFSQYDPKAPHLETVFTNQTSYLIVSGKLIVDIDGHANHMDSGITVGKFASENNFAYYKLCSKQLVIQCDYEEKDLHSTIFSMVPIRNNEYYERRIDLSAFPPVRFIDLFGKGSVIKDVVLVDESGGLVLVTRRDSNLTDYEWRPFFEWFFDEDCSRRISGVGEHVKYMYNPQILFLFASFEHGLFVTREGLDTVAYHRTRKLRIFVRQRFKKAVVANGNLFILFDSGKVYKLSVSSSVAGEYVRKGGVLDITCCEADSQVMFIEEHKGSMRLWDHSNDSVHSNIRNIELTKESRFLKSFGAPIVVNTVPFNYLTTEIWQLGAEEPAYKTICRALKDFKPPVAFYFKHEEKSIETFDHGIFDSFDIPIRKVSLESEDESEEEANEQIEEGEPDTNKECTEKKPAAETIQSIEGNTSDQEQSHTEVKAEEQGTLTTEDTREAKIDRTVSDEAENKQEVEKPDPVEKKAREAEEKKAEDNEGSISLLAYRLLSEKVLEEFYNYHTEENPSERVKSEKAQYHVLRKNEFVVEESMPPITEDVQFIIKTKGWVKNLDELKSALTSSSTLNDEKSTDLHILPNFLEMPDAEFEMFKEETKGIWSSKFEEMKPLVKNNWELIITILSKRMEEDPHDRTKFYELFERSVDIGAFQEFKEHYQTDKENKPDTNILNNVLGFLRLLNRTYLEYIPMIPLFQRYNYELDLKKKFERYVFPSFQHALKYTMQNENYIYPKLDRLKGMKNTSLKRQNRSLLNQIVTEGAYHESDPYHCFLLEKLEMKFTGERKTVVTDSWNRHGRPEKRLLHQPRHRTEGQAQVVDQESQRSA